MPFNPPSQEELTKQTLAWWKENRPTMYRELGSDRQRMAAWAAKATLEQFQAMVDAGLDRWEAWQEASQMWAFLPSEEEKPRLVPLEEPPPQDELSDLSNDQEMNSPARQPRTNTSQPRRPLPPLPHPSNPPDQNM